MENEKVVSPCECLDILEQIKANCNGLKVILDLSYDHISKISEAGNELKSYNAKPAASPRYKDNNAEQNIVIQPTWIVTVADSIINMAENFESEKSVIIDDINCIINEVNKNEAIMEYINEEIIKIHNYIGYDGANEAFKSLKDSIAMDGNSAINNKFVNISDNYVQYWTDEPLRFEYDSKSGAYLIYHGAVAMGWTTREGFDNYCKALIEEGKKIIPAQIEEDEEIVEDTSSDDTSSDDTSNDDTSSDDTSSDDTSSDDTSSDDTSNDDTSSDDSLEVSSDNQVEFNNDYTYIQNEDGSLLFTSKIDSLTNEKEFFEVYKDGSVRIGKLNENGDKNYTNSLLSYVDQAKTMGFDITKDDNSVVIKASGQSELAGAVNFVELTKDGELKSGHMQNGNIEYE